MIVHYMPDIKKCVLCGKLRVDMKKIEGRFVEAYCSSEEWYKEKVGKELRYESCVKDLLEKELFDI